MSGRGLDTFAHSHRPEDIKVILNLRTTTSEAFFPLYSDPSNDSPQPPFYIEIHVSVKSSTQPTRPVTIATRQTPLERDPNPNSTSPDEQDESSSPVWINSALTAFQSQTTPGKTVAPFQLGLIAHHRGGFPRDLRESWDFLTIPPMGQGEAMIRHIVPRNKMRFSNPKHPESSARPEKGEKFAIKPNQRALGTYWWTWGDLEQDLAEKKFRADHWYDGDIDREELGEEWVESEGTDGAGLTMEIQNEAIVEFC